MELPSIQSFKLNNILKSIQDDSIDQLTQSVLNAINSFNNDLNHELIESIQFQADNINSILIKNSKSVKNFKHLKTPTKLNIDQELVESVRYNSNRAKELIEKLYKAEKLLPVKERLFNDVNSHKLHYPKLYEAGSKILDLNDDVVSLEDSADQIEQAEEDIAQEQLPNNNDNEQEEEDEEEEQEGTSDDKPDQLQQDLQTIYKTQSHVDEVSENIKDRRISMLSKNIDEIISERVQQQQLQSITKPTSLIFPTQLTKKTSSQFNEDVRAILIKDPNEKAMIFGLKKFL